MNLEDYTPFALTNADKSSSAWVKLVPHFKAQIELLRSQLEGDKSDIETAKFRGRIAAYRAILRLNDEVPAAPE